MEERKPGYEKDAMFTKRIKPKELNVNEDSSPKEPLKHDNLNDDKENQSKINEEDQTSHNLIVKTSSPDDETNSNANVSAKNKG